MDCEKEIKKAVEKIALVYKESHWKGIDVQYVSILNEQLRIVLIHCKFKYLSKNDF